MLAAALELEGPLCVVPHDLFDIGVGDVGHHLGGVGAAEG